MMNAQVCGNGLVRPRVSIIIMVLLEHVGYGGRDRQVFMYYWDLRDGPEFAGWWVTPDYIGNNEFFLNCNGTEAATPSDCACGAWRSPNVEELQVHGRRTSGREACAP